MDLAEGIFSWPDSAHKKNFRVDWLLGSLFCSVSQPLILWMIFFLLFAFRLNKNNRIFRSVFLLHFQLYERAVQKVSNQHSKEKRESRQEMKRKNTVQLYILMCVITCARDDNV